MSLLEKPQIIRKQMGKSQVCRTVYHCGQHKPSSTGDKSGDVSASREGSPLSIVISVVMLGQS